MDAGAALNMLPDSKRQAAKQQLAATTDDSSSGNAASFGVGGSGSASALESALNHAAKLVARLRDSSGYRWVDLGVVFSRMKTSGRNNSGSSSGSRAAAAAGGRVV